MQKDQRIPFQFTPNISFPKPTANFSTRTPSQRQTTRCPSSWITTTNVKIKSTAIVVSIFSPFLRPLLGPNGRILKFHQGPGLKFFDGPIGLFPQFLEYR